MAGRRKGKPRTAQEPPNAKVIRQGGEPSGYDNETIVWRFGAADLGGEWGWQTAAGPRWWRSIFPTLCHLETMTWAELFRASGGRHAGNNHHPVQVKNLTKQAKERLEEIGQEDVSELISLRLSGRERVYGIRDRRALKVLWYDPHHGTNARAVYPVRKR